MNSKSLRRRKGFANSRTNSFKPNKTKIEHSRYDSKIAKSDFYALEKDARILEDHLFEHLYDQPVTELSYSARCGYQAEDQAVILGQRRDDPTN